MNSHTYTHIDKSRPFVQGSGSIAAWIRLVLKRQPSMDSFDTRLVFLLQ